MVKSKLSPRSGSGLETVKPHHEKGPTWGVQNEQVALKKFYSQELPKHNDLKIQNCIFLQFIHCCIT